MNSYFGGGSMVGGGMYGKDVYNPNSPDYGDYSRPDNKSPGGNARGKGTVGNSRFRQDTRTMDFQDKNGNGTDDRDEGGNFVDTDKDGTNDNAPQQSESGQEFDRIQQGYENFQNNMGYGSGGNSFSDNFFQPVDKDNDRINDLQTGLYADQVGKNFDMARSEQQADVQSGLYKDNALFGANLELRNNRELTADQFAYTQRDKDKTFKLTDEFQNREYGRNIGTMAATGEQTRKNYRAQGVENRLGTITQGEQNRLQSAADGDQARRGYRVLGDETRQTDTNKITTQGSEDRKNYEFEDNINARGEARSAARAKGLARGF